MANPIRRIVQLVLDKASAQKTEQDARTAVGGVESALGSLKRMAENVGAALIAAFGIRKILDFAKAAVETAAESERAWNDLRGTITAAGGDFAALEPQLRATAEAMQDATTFDNEDYARALKEVIAITGDVGASVHNMGLVANVAAQFFGGDMVQAAEAVGRAMNGNVMMLQRMGIRIADDGIKPLNGMAGASMSAQQALDLLAQRSMGAASRQTETFGGRLKQLNNLWDDFKKQLGFALIGAKDTAGGLDVLMGVVRVMIKWVEDNKDAIRRWVHDALSVTLTVLDAIYRAIRGTGELMVGAFMFQLGLFGRGWLTVAQVLLNVLSVLMIIPRKLGGLLGLPDPIGALTTAINENKAALDAWLKSAQEVGAETFRQGLQRFATPGALAGLNLPALTPPRRTPTPGEGVRPEVGAVGEAEARNRAIADAWAIADARDEAEQWMLDRMEEARHKSLAMAWDLAMGEIDAAEFGVNQRGKLRDLELAAQADAAKTLVDVAGAALTGNLGPYAKMKAQQDALEGAEQMVRGAIALLNPLTAGAAGGYFATGAELLALSAAWAALGSVAGGANSGMFHTAGSSATPAATSGASAGPASSAEAAKQDVNIYLIGPGWDALNPEVQRVVWGAQQLARERYGSTGVVRMRRG